MKPVLLTRQGKDTTKIFIIVGRTILQETNRKFQNLSSGQYKRTWFCKREFTVTYVHGRPAWKVNVTLYHVVTAQMGARSIAASIPKPPAPFFPGERDTDPWRPSVVGIHLNKTMVWVEAINFRTFFLDEQKMSGWFVYIQHYWEASTYLCVIV